jgi:two-component system, OmpR family, phosphate regulon sensor histidine kinase PhoR
MKRLRRLILLFCLAISIPLGYVIRHTYQGLGQEERAQLRFFSEALFDEMEKEMADLVQREEGRSVDEYHYTLAQDTGVIRRSPLSKPPDENYILGYLQNNPDGSFQTPLVADLDRVPPRLRAIVDRLKETNTIFNRKKFAIAQQPAAEKRDAVQETARSPIPKEKAAFADRYLSKSRQQAPKDYLGENAPRTEEITAGQALNLSKADRAVLDSRPARHQTPINETAETDKQIRAGRLQVLPPGTAADAAQGGTAASPPAPAAGAYAFQVEVAPLQSVHISTGRFFIFRRIAINNQIFRQGFVLQTDAFLHHLAATYFDAQPMAQFAALSLEVMENGRPTESVRSGRSGSSGDDIARRTFPAPFDFISAAVQAAAIPPSPVRRTLNLALGVLGVFMLLGLLAIYQSARTVVDLSERRSQFVSSVTHELKTPLTNIRMYIEMLEQGVAANPEREHDYLQILGSESARLSRLINNVLELARLEKKQRHFELRKDRLEEVFAELRTIMGQKLQHDGFELKIGLIDLPAFAFDREVLIQILINLMENSIKFGRTAAQKIISITADLHGTMVRISVCDTGPGIPRQSLKKVFQDFYRVDNDLTRITGGTGIGLALVKKFMTAMGGHVQAVNNTGPGCTIILLLPRDPIIP